MAEVNWGLYYFQQHRFEEALAHFQNGLKIKPDAPDLRCDYAVTLTQMGRLDEAVEEFRKTLNYNPSYLPAMQNLAWTEATSRSEKLRNPADSLKIAQRAVELTQENDEWQLDTLAAAYAATADFAKASETETKAVSVATTKGNLHAADEMQQRLALYQGGQPYFE